MDSEAKKISKELKEMSPQMVCDTEFGMDDLHKNKKTAAHLISQKKKILKQYKGATLYRVGNKIFLYEERTSKILFFSQFEKKKYGKIGDTLVIQQRCLWSSGAAAYEENLASEIFFKTLLKETGTITSDQQQTMSGMRFWDKKIVQAMKKGFHVYYVNLMQPFEHIKITSPEQYAELRSTHEIWGDDEKHKARRMVISKKELKE